MTEDKFEANEEQEKELEHEIELEQEREREIRELNPDKNTGIGRISSQAKTTL